MGLTIKKYSATWCGPCQMLKPVFESLKIKYAGRGISFQDIDVDAGRDQALQENVRSVPTVIFMKNGVEVERIQGAQPLTAYEAAVNRNLF